MPQPPLDPPVADTAPNAETLTSYDEEHLVTYLRLLDAEADGADWTEATRLVLHIDASREPARAPCLGEPFDTREMDDRARLSASSAGQGLWLTSATAGHPQPRILSRWNAAQAVRAAHRKRCARAFTPGLCAERSTTPSPRLEKIIGYRKLRAGGDSQKLHKNDCGRICKTPDRCFCCDAHTASRDVLLATPPRRSCT